MDVKLTLKLNKDIIDQAKVYAARHNRSLSRIIEAYLHLLVSEDRTDGQLEEPITPYVKSLSQGIQLPPDFDERNEVRKHQTKKHD
ncbi:MAG: hypothetical protein KDC76_10750 [Bacteroidetes bacterium]|nr:hypothetical protein [Bacteroidota bacterium]